ncbi:MAG: DUF2085 domain-containing protein [Patescibacteria group bacterium]
MFPKILYLIGSAFCAQTASHSFFYNGQKLPLDARETGVYLGFLVVFIFWLFKIKKKPHEVFPLSLLAPITLSILYFAFDGFSSIFEMSWVNNWTRLFSGLFFGQSLAILVLLVLSHSLWSYANSRQRVKIITWPQYLALSIINTVIFFLFWFDIKPLFYLSGFLIIFGLMLGIFLVNFAALATIFSEKIQRRKIKMILGMSAFVLAFFEFSFLIWLRNFLGA